MEFSRITPWTLAGLAIASLLGFMPSPLSASEQPQPVKRIIALESAPMKLPPPAMGLSEHRRQSSSDQLSIPLKDVEHEIRRIAYLRRWDQAWFEELVVEIVRRRCGVELATLHPSVQQAYANTIAFQISTTLSPEVQNGMGHSSWIKTRADQIAAAAPSQAEWQAQLSDRLSPILPSGENWAADIADPTLNVLHTAAKFDLIHELEPEPSQFSAVNGLSCGQSTPTPAVSPATGPQSPAPEYTAPKDSDPKRSPLRIALSNVAGAIAFRQTIPAPKH